MRIALEDRHGPRQAAVLVGVAASLAYRADDLYARESPDAYPALQRLWAHMAEHGIESGDLVDWRNGREA